MLRKHPPLKSGPYDVKKDCRYGGDAHKPNESAVALNFLVSCFAEKIGTSVFTYATH